MPTASLDSSPTLAQALAGRRVGLVLCARFFGFYGHLGLLRALDDAGLRPAAYSGTSAGALVAAFAGSGLTTDRVAAAILPVRLADFWDPAGPLSWLAAGLPAPGLIRGERFHDRLRRALPVRRFEECAAPVYMEAVDLRSGQLEVLHDGELSRAVWASCAYPGMFQPVRLGEGVYWDGGLVNKAPIACLAERRDLDALLVHWLPSSSLGRDLPSSSSALGLLRCLTRGVAVGRREVARQQARAATAGGLPVYVIASDVPGSGPHRMHLGPRVVEASRRAAAAALAGPASAALLDAHADKLR